MTMPKIQFLFTPGNLLVTAIKKSFDTRLFKGEINGDMTKEFYDCRRAKINEIMSDLPEGSDQSEAYDKLLDDDYLNEAQVRKVAEEFGVPARVVATLASLYGRVCGMGQNGWQLTMFDEADFLQQLQKKYSAKICQDAVRDFPTVFEKNVEFGFHQNERQSLAMCVDHELALMCVRSGMFQTPLSIYKSLGYSEVAEMRTAHCRAEEHQLRDFLKDLLKTEDIKDSLKRTDWTQFARLIRTNIPASTFANVYLELHAYDWVEINQESLVD